MNRILEEVNKHSGIISILLIIIGIYLVFDNFDDTAVGITKDLKNHNDIVVSMNYKEALLLREIKTVQDEQRIYQKILLETVEKNQTTYLTLANSFNRMDLTLQKMNYTFNELRKDLKK